MAGEVRRTIIDYAGTTTILDPLESLEVTNILAATLPLTIEPRATWARKFKWALNPTGGPDDGSVEHDMTTDPNVSEARMRIFQNKTRQEIANWNSNAYVATTNEGGGRIDLTDKANGKLTINLTAAQTAWETLNFEIANYTLEVKTGSIWIRLLEGSMRLGSGV